jgi:hypothetical protein
MQRKKADVPGASEMERGQIVCPTIWPGEGKELYHALYIPRLPGNRAQRLGPRRDFRLPSGATVAHIMPLSEPQKEGSMLYWIVVIIVVLIILGFVFGRGRGR